MSKFKLSGWMVEALIIAAGVIILGLCIKGGIDNFVNKDRVVTVKGLSEKEVPANKVTWPIVTKEMGNDLPSLYAKINSTNAAVVAFLKQNGLSDKEITVNPPVLVDKNANEYNYNERAAERYYVKSVITVTSDQVEKVRGIIAKQGELLRQGIAIVADSYENSIRYDYTSFLDMKPKMMEEAIEKAKATGEQFAKQCGSELNKIVTADQGQFSIEDRDENTPHIKVLRVVTTITYSLKN